MVLYVDKCIYNTQDYFIYRNLIHIAQHNSMCQHMVHITQYVFICMDLATLVHIAQYESICQHMDV